MVSRDEVIAALAPIPGPDGRTSLRDSGAVSGVTIRDGKVFVAIAIDPARAKAMELMRAEAEAAVESDSGRRWRCGDADGRIRARCRRRFTESHP